MVARGGAGDLQSISQCGFQSNKQTTALSQSINQYRHEWDAGLPVPLCVVWHGGVDGHHRSRWIHQRQISVPVWGQKHTLTERPLSNRRYFQLMPALLTQRVDYTFRRTWGSGLGFPSEQNLHRLSRAPSVFHLQSSQIKFPGNVLASRLLNKHWR